MILLGLNINKQWKCFTNTDQVFYYNFSMIYKAAPAWTFKGKSKTPAEPSAPSPHTYQPSLKSTLTKTPAWKMGKQLRRNQKWENNPSPTSYNPPNSPKINKMGIIGSQPRGKQNHERSPGPCAYEITSPKDGPSIGFAAKTEFINKTKHFPGPGQYQMPEKREKRGIVMGRQCRFTDQYPDKKNRPGPGAYSSLARPTSATVSFGQAPRMSHQTNKDLLGPGQYNIKSEFERKERGFTMNSKAKADIPDQTPGPNSYSPNHFDLAASPKISICGKHHEKQAERSPSPSQYNPDYQHLICRTESHSIGKAERVPLHDRKEVPGPGAYLTTQYTNTGVEISLGKSSKIEEPDGVPGPGAYNPKKQVIQKRPKSAKIGTSQRFNTILTESSPNFYEITKNSRTPKYSFSRDRKLESRNKDTPGPGAYTVSSTICNLSSYAMRR